MSRSLTVALVRHAATAWTAAGRVQGRADPALSPEGLTQAAGWRLPVDLERLRHEGRLGWAASPLRRAVETARALGAPAPRLDPRLMERDYGEWTGLPRDELVRRWGATSPGWHARPPGGESAAEVLGRARGCLDELAAEDGPACWVLVTHSGVIRGLLAAAIGWDLQDPEPLRLLPERLHRLRRRGDGHLQLLTLNEPLTPP